MCFKLKQLIKSPLFIIGALGILFFNEFLIYWIAYSKWPEWNRHAYDEDSTRLLLIADPQLIGDTDEPWFYKAISKWDCDRYLHYTYLLAKLYAQPNATIFLGDLFDEGLKATDDQYTDYYNRFNRIYDLRELSNTAVYISGDNDIGGESFNDRNEKLSKRFVQYFTQKSNLVNLYKLKYLRFLTLDLDYTYNLAWDKFKLKNIQKLLRNKNYTSLGLDGLAAENSNKDFFILLNHMSIAKRDDDEIRKMFETVNAGMVIKGHDHTFYIAKYSLTSTNPIEEYITLQSDPSNNHQFSIQPANERINSFYEISIPTCSYRMGVKHMGFGMMTITKNGLVSLSILWLPSRFLSLYYYLIFVFVIILILLLSSFFKFLFSIKHTFDTTTNRNSRKGFTKPFIDNNKYL